MFGLNLIKKLKPAKWKYIQDDKRRLSNSKITLGFIAQDIEKILNQETYSIINTDNEGMLMVEYYQLLAPIVKSIQELDERITKLEMETNKHDEI